MAHISNHSGKLHGEIISRVTFAVRNLFVIFKVKYFGEVGPIFTFKALIFFLTFSFSVMLLSSNLSSKLCIAELALELLIPQTIPTWLVIFKVISSCVSFLTRWVTQKWFPVSVYSFKVNWQLLFAINEWEANTAHIFPSEASLPLMLAQQNMSFSVVLPVLEFLFTQPQH